MPLTGPITKPLEGVKVFDLSRVFAGPIAGRTLLDLGADVVKVEPPDGDVTRLWERKAAGLSTSTSVRPTVDGPKMLTGGLRWIWHQLSITAGLVDSTPKEAAVIDTLDTANLAWADVRDCGEVLESSTSGSVSALTESKRWAPTSGRCRERITVATAC